MRSCTGNSVIVGCAPKLGTPNFTISGVQMHIRTIYSIILDKTIIQNYNKRCRVHDFKIGG